MFGITKLNTPAVFLATGIDAILIVLTSLLTSYILVGTAVFA
jgi:hypothetical protein